MKTSLRKSTFVLLTIALSAFSFSRGMAATFCVDNPTAMAQALESSSANGEDDVIRIVQGSQLGDVTLPRENGFLIKIEGGYSPGCVDRIEAPSAPTESEGVPETTESGPQQSTTGPTPPPSVEGKSEIPLGDNYSGGADTVVVGVPGYLWRHGCGPTAVGMVVGYWDGKGCSALFDGSATTQTTSVNQGIASQGSTTAPRHYEDYSLPDDSNTAYPIKPDKSALPVGDEHTSDSIADFMYTSWSSQQNRYGWSWSNHITPAFLNYVKLRSSSYNPTAYEYTYPTALTWSRLTSEINAKRPMVFLVDSSGDGYTDHFVTVVGYRLDGTTQYYGCLDTWSPADVIRWVRFRGMSSSYQWGVSRGYTFNMTCSVTPPPPTPLPTASSNAALDLINKALIATRSKPPIWGATSNVCCSQGPYTFSLNSGGVTRHSTLQTCGGTPTWEGAVKVTEGTKYFSWSTYGSTCYTYYGQFYFTLNKNRAYYFWPKWNGYTVEVWVSIYEQTNVALNTDSLQEKGSLLSEERVSVMSIPNQAVNEASGLKNSK